MSSGPTRYSERVSEEIVELVRKASEAFNEGGVEALRPFCIEEEIVFEEPPEQPAPRRAEGADEVTSLFKQFDEAWAEHRSELEEVRSVGSDRVLTLTVEHFRGRDGVEVSAPCGSIFTLRDGKIIRWQSFWDQQTALKAAGFSE